MIVIRAPNRRRSLLACLAAALGLSAQLLATPVPAADASLPAAMAPYAGNFVYVDFWASWCGPCAQSFPWLNQMKAKYGSRLQFVAVNVDSEQAPAQAFLGKHPATFDVVFDAKGTLAEHYHIDGMPSTLILDPSGHVIEQHSGFRSELTADYEAAIRKAIAAAPATRNDTP